MQVFNFLSGLDSWVVYTLIIGVVLFIILVVCAIVSSLRDRHMTLDKIVLKRVKEREKRDKTERRGKVIFNTTRTIPILKTYIRMVEEAYLSICPYSRPLLIRNVSTTLVIAFMVSVIGVVSVLVFNIWMSGGINLYSISCSVLISYIMCIEVLNYRVMKAENKITQDLIVFISKVKHNYNVCKNVPKSISLASDGMSFEITLHANEIYEILTSLNRRERVKDYVVNPKSNRYLKMFITQAYEASEKGDTENDQGVPTFISNMEFFRMDIMKEVYAIQKRVYALQGYTFVTVLPLFALPVFRKWGIDLNPELEMFYNGGGQFIVILTFIATLIIYRSVNRARNIVFGQTSGVVNPFESIGLKDNDVFKRYMERMDNTSNPTQRKIRQMLLETGSNPKFSIFAIRSFCSVVLVFVMMLGFFVVNHIQEKSFLTTQVNNIDTIVAIATERQKEGIKSTILNMVHDYYNSDDLSDNYLMSGISNYIYLSNKQTKLAMAQEIRLRIETCRASHLQWYEILISSLLGFLALFIPYIELKYKHGLVLDGRAKEVRQFQAIIIMERVFSDVSAVDLLENMETYSMYFKRDIRECINNYSTGPKSALIKLRDSSDYQDFRDLIESFINVEDIGVSVAFAEVTNNREMIEKTNELMQDIQLNKKQDTTDLISKIPAILAVGVYFILPFGLYVFGDMDEMFEMLDSFKNY